MKPEQPLIIYEIRATDPEYLKFLDHPTQYSELGPHLAGLHWEADFAFIFFTEDPGDTPKNFIQAQPFLELRHIHHLSYAQWQDGAGAEPFTVASLTFRRPEGCAEGACARADTLFIEPGLAFGFGGHPTTHACLGLLARVCQEKKTPALTSALDLGAGTGVLSLAAARWGIAKVTGVDYSHLAVAAAQTNLTLNKLSHQVTFTRAPAQEFATHPGDILLANLHLSLQEELLDLGAFAHRHRIIISGLLPTEGDLLREKLMGTGLRLIDQIRTDRWITMLLGR